MAVENTQTLLRQVLWQTNRRWRLAGGLLAVLLAALPDGLIGKGWDYGFFTSGATMVVLLLIEVVVTAWLHWSHERARAIRS